MGERRLTLNLERILANRELDRRGFSDRVEVKLHMAKFYLDHNTNEQAVSKMVHKMTQKFFDQLEMEGWEVKDLPVCRKVRQIDESDTKNSQLYIPGSEAVWHQVMLATENTIPKEHPWSREGQDLYAIWIKARRKGEVGVMEIDDETLEGMIDRDDSTLKGIVIH